MAGNDKPQRIRKPVNIHKRHLEADSDEDQSPAPKKKVVPSAGQKKQHMAARTETATRRDTGTSENARSTSQDGPTPASLPARSGSHRAPSIEVIEEPQPCQRSPKNPNVILEEDDGSEDDDEAVPVKPTGNGVRKTMQEDDDAKLERLQRGWTGFIYAFYEPHVDIEYVAGKGNTRRCTHVFSCFNKGCSHKVRRYQDTSDKYSTGNMIRHAESCWGKEAVEIERALDDRDAAREKVAVPLKTSGSITAAFARKGKGKITYSTRQHTKTETRVEIVKWMAAKFRPFAIVEDDGFKTLMKTGRPEYYLPSRSTVSRDVKQVFVRTRARIARFLQDYDGELSFQTDMWTSPNHIPYMGTTVTFELEGAPMTIVLDVVQVAKSHTGLTMAAEFMDLLEEFGIENKILAITSDNASNNDKMCLELATLVAHFSKRGRVRCFTHILNLVSRQLLKPFDVSEKKPGKTKNGEGETDRDKTLDGLLASLAEQLDLEEELMPDVEDVADGQGGEDVDDVDVPDDELAELTNAEQHDLKDSLTL